MGIKFHCPNGHKMHVKSFLAGKKGICPKCGVRVEIPPVSDAESPPPSALENPASTSVATDDLTPAETSIGKPRPPAFGLDISAPSAEAAGFSETPDAPLELDEGLDLETLDDASVLAPQPPDRMSVARQGASPSSGDATLRPLSEALLPASVAGVPQASNASWYASLPNGTTVGPISAGAVLQGLQQGKFTADSLIWRDGWGQWQPLGSVLSQLSETAAVGAGQGSTARADDPLSEALGGQPTGSSSFVHGRRRTRKEVRARVAMILMGLVIVLFALMLYVLSMKHD